MLMYYYYHNRCFYNKCLYVLVSYSIVYFTHYYLSYIYYSRCVSTLYRVFLFSNSNMCFQLKRVINTLETENYNSVVNNIIVNIIRFFFKN